ncbi:hypothetical protein MT418_007704 [Batrachochytrium dendrobatidis]
MNSTLASATDTHNPIQVIIKPFSSFKTQCFFPDHVLATISDIKLQLIHRLDLPTSSITSFSLCKESGCYIQPDVPLSDIHSCSTEETRRFPLVLAVVPIMCGGKGGFGSMLRAQGGRMASKKPTSTDSCRDLSGRRVKTVNDAKALAAYIEKEPERQRLKNEKIAQKIEKGLKEPVQRKIRFDDPEFENDHDDTMDLVNNAVEQGLKRSRSTVNTRAAPAPKKRLAMWDESTDEETDSKASPSSSTAGPEPLKHIESLDEPENLVQPKSNKKQKGKQPV